MSAAPVCVLGMPRSGTTWVGKILDSHPWTLYRHEADSGGSLDAVPIHAAPERAGVHADAVRAFVAALPARRSLKVCGKRPLFAKAYRPGWRGPLHRTSIAAARFAAVARLRFPVLDAIDRGRGEPVTVWKSIESTGRAGLIAEAVPDARIIVVVRHPCGQIDSTLHGESGGRFTDACAAANDWGIFELLLETPQARRRGLTREMLRAATPEERLAWRWLLFNEKAMEELRARRRGHVLCYEDLCAEPLAGARKLLAAAGLAWHPAVEAFVHASTAADDPRYYSVFRSPERAAHAWRDRLDASRIERIRAIVADTAPGRLFPELRSCAAAEARGDGVSPVNDPL